MNCDLIMIQDPFIESRFLCMDSWCQHDVQRRTVKTMQHLSALYRLTEEGHDDFLRKKERKERREKKKADKAKKKLKSFGF